MSSLVSVRRPAISVRKSSMSSLTSVRKSSMSSRTSVRKSRISARSELCSMTVTVTTPVIIIAALITIVMSRRFIVPGSRGKFCEEIEGMSRGREGVPVGAFEAISCGFAFVLRYVV